MSSTHDRLYDISKKEKEKDILRKYGHTSCLTTQKPLTRLLVEKGIITKEEFLKKMVKVF